MSEKEKKKLNIEDITIECPYCYDLTYIIGIYYNEKRFIGEVWEDWLSDAGYIPSIHLKCHCVIPIEKPTPKIINLSVDSLLLNELVELIINK